MVKNITGTRSYIIIELDDNKKIKIEGELTLTPAFYANKSSIKTWEGSDQALPLSENDIDILINDILDFNYRPDNTIKVIFED